MQNECDYLCLVEQVIQYGLVSDSRAGPTRSLPGVSIGFDLQEGFPLLTTRKMFTKGIFGELAAFVRGAEDLGTFESFGCNYWKDNAAKWHENHGKPESEWRVGRSYGSLWRNFDGVDQLSAVIESLKKDPLSRRHVVSAWHPAAQACLPSCHILFQFYVREQTLHCQVYMRSVDLCVGLPSDVVLYALLTHLVAKEVGLKVGKLNYAFGDAHVYENHVEQFLEVQLPRIIYEAPKLRLAEQASVLTFTPDQAEILDYVYSDAIKYQFNA